MSSAIDREWIEARIAATKEAIIAHEEAITALSGGAQMYTLDTGQTKQTVMKSQLSQVRDALWALEDRLQYYVNKLEGRGPVRIIPGY
jgi:hypothetical protein